MRRFSCDDWWASHPKEHGRTHPSAAEFWGAMNRMCTKSSGGISESNRHRMHDRHWSHTSWRWASPLRRTVSNAGTHCQSDHRRNMGVKASCRCVAVTSRPRAQPRHLANRRPSARSRCLMLLFPIVLDIPMHLTALPSFAPWRSQRDEPSVDID